MNAGQYLKKKDGRNGKLKNIKFSLKQTLNTWQPYSVSYVPFLSFPKYIQRLFHPFPKQRTVELLQICSRNQTGIDHCLYDNGRALWVC